MEVTGSNELARSMAALMVNTSTYLTWVRCSSSDYGIRQRRCFWRRMNLEINDFAATEINDSIYRSARWSTPMVTEYQVLPEFSGSGVRTSGLQIHISDGEG